MIASCNLLSDPTQRSSVLFKLWSMYTRIAVVVNDRDRPGSELFFIVNHENRNSLHNTMPKS